MAYVMPSLARPKISQSSILITNRNLDDLLFRNIWIIGISVYRGSSIGPSKPNVLISSHSSWIYMNDS